MRMKFSDAGLALLKQAEGFRAKVYHDAAGLLTIGYGHRLLNAASFPDGIDESQAAEILASDVRDAEQAVIRLTKVVLTQGRFDALVDFVFNLGQIRLANSTLLKLLNSGEYNAAAEELLKWDHVGSVEVAGLKARREAEYALWHSEA